GFHKFMRRFLPWLGVPELEKVLVNISRVIEQIENQTNDAISTLQQEVTSLSKVVKQNQMSLDLSLTPKGDICTGINTSCCVYIDQILLRTETDLE
ncbi:ERVV2 protein, partial [Spizella passerina]|nr:ERVV2 protein [Spizella passerina]